MLVLYNVLMGITHIDSICFHKKFIYDFDVTNHVMSSWAVKVNTRHKLFHVFMIITVIFNHVLEQMCYIMGIQFKAV